MMASENRKRRVAELGDRLTRAAQRVIDTTAFANIEGRDAEQLGERLLLIQDALRAQEQAEELMAKYAEGPDTPSAAEKIMQQMRREVQSLMEHTRWADEQTRNTTHDEDR